MKSIIKEESIFKKAAEAFKSATGLDISFCYITESERHDAVMDIMLDDKKLHFDVDINNSFANVMIGPAVQRIKKKDSRTIIAASYITPQVADKLRELDVPFIDTAGNVFIKADGLYVFVKGNRPEANPAKRLKAHAFRATGLQVVYALLCNPGLEAGNYRKIASISGVALGTVGWVMQDIINAGYLVDMGRRGRRLVQKEKLLSRWVTSYAEQLRPKKMIATYNTIDPEFWQKNELPPGKAFWGGEVAAAKLNKYLKPETITIYTSDEKALFEYMVENRFKKDQDGKVEVIKIFWDLNIALPHNNLVHPLLIYADLIATGNPRNIETGANIYEEELAEFIRED